MAVIGVLTEPTPPTWWKANRHKVYGIGGLLLGYLIASHLQGTPAQEPQNPRPNHSTPAPTTPSLHRTA
ncbi:hypothetical protein OH787_40690 (plasmid) [Streptomyces sp. NBC_01547]|uniref:hypothetical protein n=1 Tax=Streptomyces sp. NBC_01547 TaxID=2975873 RepID=UPI002F9174F2